MADENALEGNQAQSIPPAENLPERPKEDAPTSELKKMAKAKEKAEKQARLKAEEEARKKQEEANDISKEDYGILPTLGAQQYESTGDKWADLAEVAKKYSETSSMDESGGDTIIFRARVVNVRPQSAKLAFPMFKQGFDTIQAVVAASETLSRQMVKFTTTIPNESIVLVHGVVKKPKEPVNSATISHLEIHVKKIYVEAKAEVLPMQVTDVERPLPTEGEEEAKDPEGRPVVTLNTRLNNRVIDLRGKHNRAIFTIKDGVVALFQEFLRSKGFTGIQTPKLLGAPSEGGANVFEVTYFEKKAYLAQSPQLYKQMLIAAGYNRVMEVGPVFRAENSNTARHLTEFTGLDLEMEFKTNYHEVVKVLEDLMLYIFKGLRERYSRETELVRSIYNVEDFKLPESGEVPRLPWTEGIKMLREDGIEIGDFDDLSTPQEKHLGALVLKKYGTDFYVLDKFPLAIRPFYTMPALDAPAHSTEKVEDPNAGYSNSYDFFMRGQEILSGAQRIHNAEFLQKRMREGVTPVDPNSDGLRDYVNAFRYGCPPHAGGGIGLERIVMLYLGLPNIRLASLFPRDPSRLIP
ncbi:hypothetical protein H2203_001466 [Taxawa tesnikishii (nom. ined.)]|nr:hypothetical protein H2203_001466 [Dothideales sp. JES 119]